MLGNIADEGLLLENDDVMETAVDININTVKLEKQKHPCELCVKIFSNRAALNKHTSKNHPDSGENKKISNNHETLVGKDTDDEGLLLDNDVAQEFDEDISENGNANKSFDMVDIETIQVEKKMHACETCEKKFTNRAALNKHVSKNHTNSVEKGNNVHENTDDLPTMKKIKTNSEPHVHVQAKQSTEGPINYEYIINCSEYFRKNLKLITTKCNIALHSMNIFSLDDPMLPSGWKMREHTKPDGESEKHFLAPDGRVLKTRRAVMEYLSVLEKYSEEQNKDKDSEIKKKQNNINQAEFKNMPKSTERKERKKTKTKLPGMPKKPMSSFFIFMGEEGRARAKKENPSATIGEIGKLVGEMWAKIEDKTKWEEKTKAAKEKYEEEYKEWFENGGEEALKKAKENQRQNTVRKDLLSDRNEQTHTFGNLWNHLTPLDDNSENAKDPKKKSAKRKSNERSSEMKPARRSGMGEECPQCHKVVGALKRHLDDIHSPPGHFPCPGCDKVFTSRNKQSSHTSRHCNPNNPNARRKSSIV